VKCAIDCACYDLAVFARGERASARWIGVALLASVAAHAGLLLLERRPAKLGNLSVQATASEFTLDIADSVLAPVPALSGDGAIAATSRAPELLPRGGRTVARADGEQTGRGGELAGEAAENLAEAAERMRFAQDLQDRLDRSQLNRLRNSLRRTSWENLRAAREVQELTFVASGQGTRMLRAVPVDNPSKGVREAATAAALGGQLGAAEAASIAGASETIASAAGNAESAGEREPRPALGDRAGAPDVALVAGASIGRARPSVHESTPLVAALRVGRVEDRMDSDQAVATTLRALVRESPAGGISGDGTGGTAGGGVAGADGRSGAGAKSVVLGPGGGNEWLDLDAGDPNLLPYYRRLRAKIDPRTANAFPRAAAAELRQGYVVLQVIINKEGGLRVLWPPVRASGIAEYDHNCRAAVESASPFEPIPASLGARELRVKLTFRAQQNW
jgi:TonB family protein